MVKKPTTRRPRGSSTPVVRPQEIEDEIQQALATPKEAWRSNAPNLRPETLVHLAKHLKSVDEADLLGDLLEKHVFPRATPVIKANSKSLAFDDRSEILREVFMRITQAVMNGSPQVPDFLEAKFGLKVKQWTIDAVRQVLRQSGRLVPIEPAHELQREVTAWNDEDTDHRHELFGTRCSAAVAEVLSGFPDHVQQAFLQHAYEGIPIESARSSVLSIASIHNVSGRAVRLWFAKIRDAVKEKLRSNAHEHD